MKKRIEILVNSDHLKLYRDLGKKFGRSRKAQIETVVSWYADQQIELRKPAKKI